MACRAGEVLLPMFLPKYFMEVSWAFHILLPLLTFGYGAGWNPELVRTLEGWGDKSDSVVVQPVAKSVY
jgi:hypothetical protein